MTLSVSSATFSSSCKRRYAGCSESSTIFGQATLNVLRDIRDFSFKVLGASVNLGRLLDPLLKPRSSSACSFGTPTAKSETRAVRD
jgi:hypothetical protein